MNDRLNFLLRKNTGKRHMQEYLNELSKLVHRNKYKVLTLEESDIVFEKIKMHISNKYIWKYAKNIFSNKDKLKKIISEIQYINNSNVYMSLGFSEMCGIVLLDYISLFNVDFSFEDEHSGLIKFYDKELKNCLAIDFYEENGSYYYDLEIIDGNWVKKIQSSFGEDCGVSTGC